MQHSPIFTTGAFLAPLKISTAEGEKWVWTVTEFIDDTFRNGDVYNPNELADTKEELLTEPV